MQHYVGRFAPSPTGLLHAGSLIGALASYLDAKAHNGDWLVRMEDLDPPREIAGAAQAILDALQAHGLNWDGEVLWQSQRQSAYRYALEQLLQEKHAFYCKCSRTEIEAAGGIYPGTCRGQQQTLDSCCAVRLQVNADTVAFNDAIQGHYQQQLQQQVGDFVLLRKDQFFAYQLAVVVDDEYQQISHVVRGSDLLDSTPRQIFLQQRLGYRTPSYCHVPVLNNAQGQKLSKQTFATALDNRCASKNLLAALAFLRQPAPDQQHQKTPATILAWATRHWSTAAIPPVLNMTQIQR